MISNKHARSPNYRAAASEELIKGREFATQLEALLRERSSANQAQISIMTEVMATISGALVSLDRSQKTEELLQHEDDENARKKLKIQSVQRRQRGCYRRRSHPFTSRTIASNSAEDGHAWRKYGQKVIHSNKFPRCYYRCTHKYDQDCKATRQVQRSEEDPSLFVITYFGEHTCRGPMEVSSSSCFQGEDASCIIDFAKHSYPRPQLLFPKQDCREEVVTPALTPGSSSSDCFEFPALGTLDGSDQVVEEFTGAVSENSDITSGFEQSFCESLGWDFMMEESFDFREMLIFEHDVLFHNNI